MKVMKIKEITLFLENCDSITFDGKYIGDFNIEDIRTSISRIACNAVEKIDTAHHLSIEIHKDANIPYYEFEQDQYEDFKKLPFDRLTCFNDITQIGIILTESYPEDNINPKEEKYYYHINWSGDSDYDNSSQKSYISTLGHLYIVIDDELNQNKTFNDYFLPEIIDDEQYMSFHMHMFDISNKNHKEDEEK